MVPDIVDKFTSPKEELMDDNSAKELAFPESDASEK